MNTTTYTRDHFLQNGLLRAFFPVSTLGLFIDLDLTQAGKAAFYSTMFLIVLSMFYHSAIRVQLPWLDRILVTPQVHRIHHSIDPQHYNRNFADALPIFDILFGTLPSSRQERVTRDRTRIPVPGPALDLVGPTGSRVGRCEDLGACRNEFDVSRQEGFEVIGAGGPREVRQIVARDKRAARYHWRGRFQQRSTGASAGAGGRLREEWSEEPAAAHIAPSEHKRSYGLMALSTRLVSSGICE